MHNFAFWVFGTLTGGKALANYCTTPTRNLFKKEVNVTIHIFANAKFKILKYCAIRIPITQAGSRNEKLSFLKECYQFYNCL